MPGSDYSFRDSLDYGRRLSVLIEHYGGRRLPFQHEGATIDFSILLPARSMSSQVVIVPGKSGSRVFSECRHAKVGNGRVIRR